MNKTLVIYRSKYGATEKYIKWLQEEINCDITSCENANLQKIPDYNNIIFASGIYAKKITIIPFIKKNYDNIKDKNLAIFCVGISPYSEDYINSLKSKNLLGDLKDIPLFYAPGTWDVANMKFLDKLIAKVVSASVKNKNQKNNITEPNVGNSDFLDLTSKKYLSLIKDYIKI